VYAAGAVLDHDEDVGAAQEHGVDVGEVDGEDRVGRRGEELSPGPSGRQGSGVKASALRILQTVEAAARCESESSPWMRW
jgi:hypothetical protein